MMDVPIRDLARHAIPPSLPGPFHIVCFLRCLLPVFRMDSDGPDLSNGVELVIMTQQRHDEETCCRGTGC